MTTTSSTACCTPSMLTMGPGAWALHCGAAGDKFPQAGHDRGMTGPDYDDTDMTPEEFEVRIARGIPAQIQTSRDEYARAASVPVAMFVQQSGNTAGDAGDHVLAMGAIGRLVLVAPERESVNIE